MALDQQYDTEKFFLYAVNIMLQTINERPVNDDVELAEIVEAQLASSILIETKKEVLAEGWDVNTDEDYTFAQDQDGYINVPYNVLNIVSTDGDLIARNFRLYSKSGQTSKFDEPQDVNVIWDVDFNSLTHSLRHYITVKAARTFLARNVMDTDVYGFAISDEESAFLAARRSEGFTGQYNILTSNFGTTNILG